MFRLLCLIAVFQLVVSSTPARYMKGLFDDVSIDDLFDEDYDEEAERAKQEAVDERIKAVSSPLYDIIYL